MHARSTEYFYEPGEIEIRIPARADMVPYIGRVDKGKQQSNGLHSEEMKIKSETDCVEVGVGDYQIRRNMFTHNLGPCQAVIVRLSNGELGLYHASDPFTVSSTGTNESFAEFKKAISQKQIEIEEVIILEKTQGNLSNQAKAPLLAVGLADHLGVDPAKVTKVKRLKVDNYLSVACIDGKVIISNKPFNINKNPDQSQTETVITPKLKQLVREKNEAGYEESVAELKRFQAKGFFKAYEITERPKQDYDGLNNVSIQLSNYAQKREHTFKLFGSKKTDIGIVKSVVGLIEKVRCGNLSNSELTTTQRTLLKKVEDACKSKKTDPTLRGLLKSIPQLFSQAAPKESKKTR